MTESSALGAQAPRLPAFLSYFGSASALIAGAGFQFAAYVALARYLGIAQLGVLMVILAATNMAYFVCGLGCGDTMIRRVARDKSIYPLVLGHSLILVWSTGVAIVAVMPFALSYVIDPSPDFWKHILTPGLFVLGNVLFFRTVTLAEHALLAHSRFAGANAVNVGFNAARGGAAVIACTLFGVSDLQSWAVWNVSVCGIGAAVGLVILLSYGAPKWRVDKEEFFLGIHFTTPWFFYTLRQNVDLLALGFVTTSSAIGSYGLARRITETSSLAVTSLNRVLYPSLSVEGRQGPSGSLRLMRRYLPWIAGLSILTSTAVFIVAPWMPWIFGKDFGDTIFELRVLCWLLIPTGLLLAAYEALGAADLHRARAKVYITGIVAGSVAVAVLAYLWAVPGAFAGLYLSETSLAIALWVTLFRLAKAQERGEAAELPRI